MPGLNKLWRAQSGIYSVEYALLLAMIAGGLAIALDALSDAVEIQFDRKAICIRDSTSVYIDPACNN